MTAHCYRFEAKSIQSYLLATNKLKEIIGGSELIHALCDGPANLLDDVLAACGLAERQDVRFSRRAGGAFNAFFTTPEQRARFIALWTLAVAQHAPDLAFQSGMGDGANDAEAFDAAETAFHASAAHAPRPIPAGSPVAERNRRSGNTAVRRRKDGEAVDAATSRKLAYSRGHMLAARFGDYPPQSWPTLLSPEPDSDRVCLPFTGEDRTLGLIHADGNGLGQLLITLSARLKNAPHFVEAFRRFSDAIGDATTRAARLATDAVLVPAQEKGVFPARPIVLGGDDLTIIVRGDLALAFTKAFLSAFEQTTAEELKGVWEEYAAWGIQTEDLPVDLTACAGIAWFGASQPFNLAEHLAQGLCAQAKGKAKRHAPAGRVPSTVSFHRVTTRFMDDADAVLERELTLENEAGHTLRQTLAAYTLDSQSPLPQLSELETLLATLRDPAMPNGPARQVLGLMYEDTAQARIRYERFRTILAKNRKRLLERFDRALEALLRTEQSDFDARRSELPYASTPNFSVTPLGDLHALHAVLGNPAPQEDRT
ncbi:MAG: hypothetical protein AB1766_01665 [Pseudomonadota bacterium]